MTRHYGLDWLRIGAFGVLILYHVGMVFVSWDYHIKLPGADWVAVPMLASNPWRLALLFLVSGYASRALFARSTGPARFAWDRTARLIVPLVFGMIAIVPPQPWVELVAKHGYNRGYLDFWASDYFGFHKIAGLDMPTWNHLWFVVYLWLYTMLLAIVVAVTPATLRGLAQRVFDRVFATPALFVLPIAWMLAVTTWLFPGARETHALVGDWVAHASYLPMVVFGFALGGSPRVLATFARWWRPSLAIGVLSYAVAAGIELAWPGDIRAPKPWGHVFAGARGVQAWTTIAALIGIAERHWNRDHRWRATLTEAVFPFYIVHQTIIVVAAWWLLGAGLHPAANFAILVVATVAGCWAFYLAGRSIGWLRPLIGLRRRPRADSPVLETVR